MSFKTSTKNEITYELRRQDKQRLAELGSIGVPMQLDQSSSPLPMRVHQTHRSQRKEPDGLEEQR